MSVAAEAVYGFRTFLTNCFYILFISAELDVCAFQTVADKACPFVSRDLNIGLLFQIGQREALVSQTADALILNMFLAQHLLNKEFVYSLIFRTNRYFYF